MHNYRASRQQSGYELSPLSQPSVWCWVFCSDECFTRMCTSGMCLYNRLKHQSLRFKCYDSIACPFSVGLRFILKHLTKSQPTDHQQTITDHLMQPFTGSYQSAGHKVLFTSSPTVRMSISGEETVGQLGQSQKCQIFERFTNVLFRDDSKMSLITFVVQINSLIYELLQLMSIFLLNILCCTLPDLLMLQSHCRILVVTLHKHVLLILGNMQMLK